MSVLTPVSFHSVPFSIPTARSTLREQSPEYLELIRRLMPEEKASLEEKLASLGEIDDRIAKLCSALGSQNWEDEIFTDENYPYYALLAASLKEGHPHKLTLGQFATLMSFWRAGQDIDDLTPISLFDEKGNINPKAEKTLRESLWEDRKGNYLTDDQFKELLKEMAKLPKSEQQFLLSEYAVSYGEDYTLSKICSLGIHFFSLTQKGRRFIPSFGLMQTFLRVKFGPDAVTMKPVLGLSSEEDIRQNGLNGERDIALHFPGVALPDEADGYKAPGDDFTYHDYYHAFVSSSAPQCIRMLYIRIADLILQFKSSVHNLVEKKDIESLADLFIDMDLNQFLPERRKEGDTLNDLFWRRLHSLFSNHHIEENLSQKIIQAIAEQLPMIPEIIEGPAKAYHELIQELDASIHQFTKEQKTTDFMLSQNRKEACLSQNILPIWDKRLGK